MTLLLAMASCSLTFSHMNTSVSFEVDAVRVCRDGGFLVASDAEAGPGRT